MRKNRIPKGGKIPGLTQLKQLGAERRAELFELCRTRSLDEAAPKVEAATGIKVGRNSLSKFLSWQAHQMRLENYNELIARFEDFYTTAKPNASRERVRDAGIAFFLAETTANQDREGFVDVAKLDLKQQIEERKIAIAERRLRLLEQKAEQADQARAVAGDVKLSAAEKAARMKQIFGMS